jgi:hypothetical protein
VEKKIWISRGLSPSQFCQAKKANMKKEYWWCSPDRTSDVCEKHKISPRDMIRRELEGLGLESFDTEKYYEFRPFSFLSSNTPYFRLYKDQGECNKHCATQGLSAKKVLGIQNIQRHLGSFTSPYAGVSASTLLAPVFKFRQPALSQEQKDKDIRSCAKILLNRPAVRKAKNLRPSSHDQIQTCLEKKKMWLMSFIQTELEGNRNIWLTMDGIPQAKLGWNSVTGYFLTVEGRASEEFEDQVADDAKARLYGIQPWSKISEKVYFVDFNGMAQAIDAWYAADLIDNFQVYHPGYAVRSGWPEPDFESLFISLLPEKDEVEYERESVKRKGEH